MLPCRWPDLPAHSVEPGWAVHRAGPYCKTPRPPQRALCRFGVPPLPAGELAVAPAGVACLLALVRVATGRGPTGKPPAAHHLRSSTCTVGAWERPLRTGRGPTAKPPPPATYGLATSGSPLRHVCGYVVVLTRRRPTSSQMATSSLLAASASGALRYCSNSALWAGKEASDIHNTTFQSILDRLQSRLRSFSSSSCSSLLMLLLLCFCCRSSSCSSRLTLLLPTLLLIVADVPKRSPRSVHIGHL